MTRTPDQPNGNMYDDELFRDLRLNSNHVQSRLAARRVQLIRTKMSSRRESDLASCFATSNMSAANDGL